MINRELNNVDLLDPNERPGHTKGDPLIEGRSCCKCGKKKKWEHFAYKPKGINGRDSRCKSCAADAKARARETKRKLKKFKRRYAEVNELKRSTVGQLDEAVIATVGSNIGQTISSLIEEGTIR